MLSQERLPATVYVVDDGSKVDYGTLREDYIAGAARVGVTARWGRTANGGKRHAQGAAFADTPEADVYVMWTPTPTWCPTRSTRSSSPSPTSVRSPRPVWSWPRTPGRTC